MRLHSYDSEERGRVTVALFAVSILLVWLMDMALAAASFNPQWWLSVPSFGCFYAVLYWLLDNHVWKGATRKWLHGLRESLRWILRNSTIATRNGISGWPGSKWGTTGRLLG